MNRQQLEDAYPTLVVYAGLVLAVAVVGAALFLDVALERLAFAGPLATGMMLYRKVKNAVENGAA